MDRNLTEQQVKWFASVREGLERDTGKTLDAWVAIALTCPETKHRARLTWFKTHHNLGQNRASQVLHAAFPSDDDTPQAQRAALWTDAASLAILEAVEAAVADIPGLISGQRKSFTSWSRKAQFAALKPVRGGHAMLGLAVTPDAAADLSPPANEGWSERLKAKLRLTSPGDVDAGVMALLKAAASAS